MARLGILFLLSFAGCAAGGDGLPACMTPDDCRSGHRCINGRCVPPGVDAGPEIEDAGTDAPSVPDAGRDTGGGTDAGTGTDAPPPDLGTDAGPCDGPCRYYVRNESMRGWARYAMPGGAFAPTTPVRAALDIEDDNVAYLFTDTTYHVLDIAARRFTGGGTRSDLLPEAAGTPLITAETIPAGHAGSDPSREGLILSGEAIAYTGYIVRATREFVIDNMVTDFGPAWDGPLAPRRGDVRADWLDLDNAAGWVSADLRDFCDTTVMRVGPYQGIITPSAVHVADSGVCFEFVQRDAFASFPAFDGTSAPAAGTVVAAFFHQGALHVFVDGVD